MTNFSRRRLAKYAVEQIQAGHPPSIVAKQLAASMIASGKAKDHELLISDIQQEFEDRGLVANARVTSAHKLSDGQLKRLVFDIKKITGVKDVNLDQRFDKDVLGGFKLETANHAWDKTTAKILKTIKETV